MKPTVIHWCAEHMKPSDEAGTCPDTWTSDYECRVVLAVVIEVEPGGYGIG